MTGSRKDFDRIGEMETMDALLGKLLRRKTQISFLVAITIES